VVLLVIFMITEPVLQSGIEVNGPRRGGETDHRAAHGGDDRPRPEHLFERSPVNIHDLPQKLHQRAWTGAPVDLPAQHDGAVRGFASVMDAVKHRDITMCRL